MSQSSGKKVFVGLSGGVDSSVSAALLKERGFDVTGVFIKGWYPDWIECDWKEERRDAMRVCAHLDIPFATLDAEEEYKRSVIDYMIEEYRKGNTPNPDVFCNRDVKFGAFLRYALENGADFIATGHYAQIREERGAFRLFEGADKGKDQSYFLWTLTQEQLQHTLSPIGGMQKSEVRELAAKFGLPTAGKKDSQGVCFLGKIDLREFLSHYIESKPGDVLDTDGRAIGRHDGAMFLTIGQRHGFTITEKGTSDPRMFVIAKDISNNTVTVSSEPANLEENPHAVAEIELDRVNWICGYQISTKTHGVRIRYRQTPIPCTVTPRPGLGADSKAGPWTIKFDKPQAGVSPGQSAVVYDGEECVGGGIIR